MFFDGLGHHDGTSFEQTYRCYPVSFMDKPPIEKGDKIIMPPSALDQLESLHIDYPMLFELRNDATERVSHCGVLEFTADEGMMYMPYWMMENLLLQEGHTVRVKNVTLPKGTYFKLQPHTNDLLDISNPKAILETTLRNFSCLTTGDSIMVAYDNKEYYIDVIETKPSNAISIIETDCEVDFAPPLDYKEPEQPATSFPSSISSNLPSSSDQPPAIDSSDQCSPEPEVSPPDLPSLDVLSAYLSSFDQATITSSKTVVPSSLAVLANEEPINKAKAVLTSLFEVDLANPPVVSEIDRAAQTLASSPDFSEIEKMFLRGLAGQLDRLIQEFSTAKEHQTKLSDKLSARDKLIKHVNEAVQDFQAGHAIHKMQEAHVNYLEAELERIQNELADAKRGLKEANITLRKLGNDAKDSAEKLRENEADATSWALSLGDQEKILARISADWERILKSLNFLEKVSVETSVQWV